MNPATLICDELDSLQPEQRAALRNVVNSGHARDTAFFTRCEPNKEGRWKGVQFSTFGSIALGMIGEIADTIRSRAIHIPLKRALPGEQRARLTPKAKAALKDQGKALAEVVRSLDIDDDPELPPELGNRDADNWRPLIAIADAVGGEWAERARQAAIALTTQRQLTEGEQLLSDIRDVFGQRAVMRSEALAEELRQIETSPWGSMTPHSLARLLSPYGIAPKQLRIGGAKQRGYSREQFEDAWARHLRS